ncbi:unnamed protein product [Meloidogyne enterolobii]|uniref:Uncharacterized protein n=1 Tax=Meloidogyne enterolobii TaxID=390850 RepID=A0ACB0YTR8_MELEN
MPIKYLTFLPLLSFLHFRLFHYYFLFATLPIFPPLPPPLPSTSHLPPIFYFFNSSFVIGTKSIYPQELASFVFYIPESDGSCFAPPFLSYIPSF